MVIRGWGLGVRRWAFRIRGWEFRGKAWPIFSWVIFQLLIAGCSGADTKLQQYKVHGEELYLTHCSNCHQADGKGLGLLFPPLDKSDFVDGNKESVVCLIENGIEGELTVNEQSFNKPMPAIPQLTDLEIAEIVTYLYNSWGREKGIIDVTEVTTIIQKCKE